ncbi:peptidase family M3-domain-containing protein [Fusarium redolens]|uniref:Peptidase family M3-domain-containing protein n=1 Tax=Fusarium redolens TaxID=48865 RepID=A0A9P9K456_FUSRE|nr:peptidase family M3-domain-containing protein [Fusarium redolens]KAH7248622.1 peptidase family M3-domain-containing protein [Fusarium redolens]
MKRIVGQYQAVREIIIRSVDVQTAAFDNGDIAIIAMLRYASPDRASRQASEEASVKEACQETSLHFEAQKYLDKLFLEFKQVGHGTLQPVQIQEDGTGGLWFTINELAGVQQHDLDRFEKDPEKHEMRFVRFSAADSLVIYRSASKSATRKKMYIGSANNLSQNTELFKKIVVERLLDDLHHGISARGKQDLSFLVQLKQKDAGDDPRSPDDDKSVIFPWDYWYYAHVAEQRLHVDPEQIAEYFPLQHVITVILEMFSEFLQLRFCPISQDQLESSTWHEDVRAYAVWDDREASKDQFIGYLYMDLLSRDNKYKVFNQGYLKKDGSRVYPATLLMCSFPQPAPSACTLLKHSQIVSLFHELGHGIHDLLARTNYVAFHGHRSPPDFAEALSVMLEKWCWMKPELKRVGLHYTRTDLRLKEKWLREHPGDYLPLERIPDDIIERLIKGRQVTRSLWYLRHMVYARFDMTAHHPKSHTELLNMDFTKVFNDLLEQLWLVRAPLPEDQGYPHADLGHLVSGYDAGYYSYLSAHVFAEELFESTFLEDPRSVSAWDRYRKGILEFGGSRDELELLQEYLGHSPTAEPLLHDILQ